MAKSLTPKLSKPARTARRGRIATAKLAGRPTAAIARAEKLDRGTVAKDLASDECQQIVFALVERSRAQIERLFVQGLEAIEDALIATRTAVTQGAVVDLGPDHFARLAATKRLLEVISLGRPTAKAPVDAGRRASITLAELEQIVAERKQQLVIQ